MIPKYTFSHTSVTCYDTCPKLFWHRYVAKDVVFEETDASRRGSAVHAALEARLKQKAPLPEDMPYEHLAKALDDRPLLVEERLGVRADGTLASWWADDIYGRGTPDVVILPAAGNQAVILDWKTGKAREDPAELETFAVLVHARHPDLTRFTGFYVWLANIPARLGTPHVLNWKRKWTELQKSVAEIETANTFPARPNGLCRNHCGVFACPHNGRTKN